MFGITFRQSEKKIAYDSGGLELPDELLFKIISYLDSPQDLVNLFLSSRRLSQIAHDDKLWEVATNHLASVCPSFLELERGTLPAGKDGFVKLLSQYFALQQQELSLLLNNKLLSSEQTQIITQYWQSKFSYSQLNKNELLLNDVNAFLTNYAKERQHSQLRLNFSRLGLTRLPFGFVKYVKELNHIFEIDLSHNNLYYLPRDFSELLYLNRISFLDNCFNSIPRELQAWSYLPDFRGNRIAHLPGNWTQISDPETLMRSQKNVLGIVFNLDSALSVIDNLLPAQFPKVVPLLCAVDLSSKLLKSYIPLFTIGVLATKTIRWNESRKWRASRAEKDKLSPNKYKIYMKGREAKRWRPYLKSVFDLSLYRQKERSLFLVGLNDAESSQPFREICRKKKTNL